MLKLHARAWLAYYLNPVANNVFDNLHQACRRTILAACEYET